MSLATHIASAPPGELGVLLIRLYHPTWTNPLRYADSTQNWTVTLETSVDESFPKTGADADAPPTDDTGIDSRGITLPDPELNLWRRLEKLSKAGDPDPVEVKIYFYLSTDLTVPAYYAILQMVGPSRDGRTVTFDASNANTINRDAPSRRYMFADSPGLRR